MNRREFLERSAGFAGLGLLGIGGCARKGPARAAAPSAPALLGYDAVPALAPIRAHEDRLFRITVCTRPFRAAGPRVEAERVGDKLVVHNYGHGGSGWSLSWGSSSLATEIALKTNSRATPDVAVVGCGALGLTSATLLQRAGARVTIYAKERPPYVRSSRATGSWTPDSRIALSNEAPAALAAQWEQMARTSWFMYQSYLGMAGDPVEYIDTFEFSQRPKPNPEPARPVPAQPGPELDFARYSARISDLTPRAIDLPPGAHPFPADHARRNTTLMFNIADYSRQLVTDFLINGGKIETVEFRSPADLGALAQPIIINCPGYAARQLWNDATLTPVRGQIGWLIPQPEVRYGLYFDGLNVLSRRDGIVVQTNPKGELSGWNDDSEQPDRQEAETGVRQLAGMYASMRPWPPIQGRAS
jgi:glycine/D-amino acid oxidase-like deaminating enzyme